MKFSRENHMASDGNAHSPDSFDQLPDAILLEIFNKVLDAKSLVRCLAVSKRFGALIPQTHSVSLQLPRHQSAAAKPPAKLFKTLVRFLQGIAAGKRKNDSRRNALYYAPNEVLKGFTELRSLRVELPRCSGESGLKGKDSLLKWKAEFGASLESCVIVGANSVRKLETTTNGLGNDNDNTKDKSNDNAQNALTDEELKLRIVWMVSSLIAASARHYLTKRVVSSFPALTDVVVSDGDKRGRVTTRAAAGAEEPSELSTTAESAALESSLERSLIPDLGIKLWYAPKIVLHQCGRVMEGATLVVIRPLAKKSDGGGAAELVGGEEGFDGDEEELKMLGEAVREMAKVKKTYVMEMTSF